MSASAETATASTQQDVRRRQWGAERQPEPLAIIHARPTVMKVAIGRIAIVVTFLAWAMYVITTVIREFIDNQHLDFRFAAEAVGYLVVVTSLTFSALMYLIARQGALYRFRDHTRVPRAEIDRHFPADYDHGVTVLVPSYVEELQVVRKTLWSAALQEFPALRLVLLIDDPPYPKDAQRQAELAVTRQIPAEIERALAPIAERFTTFATRQARRLDGREEVTPNDVRLLAEEYEAAAVWLEEMADAWPIADHTDVFFAEQVLIGLANEFRLNLLALNAAVQQRTAPDRERMSELARRLVWTFTAKLDGFERKTFASLSHEANKAMNLNAYIGLMGHRWKKADTAEGVVLLEAAPEESADLDIPASEYLLTLDADSMLLRDYCLRLVEFLEQEGNQRVAVTQTPYSAYRGAPTRIERIAGATTDIQHILHQGLSYYNATFWVGANAVIRMRALDDICEVEMVGGFPIKTYIQDRTVIEDTESSIDIGTHGWTLVNYPERLSYSSTPPDFGSLIVQRRRWANGGLLILPKFATQLSERRRKNERILWRETTLRVNYMASISWASFGLIFLLAYPYDGRLLSPWVFLAAVPYFVMMAVDLRYSGYSAVDIFRIYGFNLVLLPINLAGVLKSMQQALTGEKIPFARTPKVSGRTAAPGFYVLVPILIVAFSAFTFWRDFTAQNWGNAAFAAFNAILCAWAIVAYIGIGNALADMGLGVLNWLWVDEKQKPKPRVIDPSAPVNWEALLYYGDRRLARDVRRDRDRRRRAAGR
ncbi:MAG TPA: glycosyltransferase family 2 protein [Propionicimonas sp.]|uniref:glycosyltransferase family 2 protein n=1 Tax=Propionicimonas sp. TaxID=1955623 RepID=UPI002F404E5B